MKHIVLLGDSILDNAAYVNGGPDVIEQLCGRLAGVEPEPGAVGAEVGDFGVLDGFELHHQAAEEGLVQEQIDAGLLEAG
jgi:hypothetical protein